MQTHLLSTTALADPSRYDFTCDKNVPDGRNTKVFSAEGETRIGGATQPNDPQDDAQGRFPESDASDQ